MNRKNRKIILISMISYPFLLLAFISFANNNLTRPNVAGEKNMTPTKLGELYCGEDGKLYVKVFSHDTSTDPRGFRVEQVRKNNHEQYICIDTDGEVLVK